jgi:hypothetical protein
MAKKLRLGVIGLSEGNGHPYSWSAIFNGYDRDYMKDCPFPVIFNYLQKQKFPDDGLTEMGEVTNIWTQSRSISEHVASASRISTVNDQPEEMLGQIDGLLLARDDAENHFQMARPFLEAGIPMFIDKPLALTVEEAHRILSLQVRPDQIFTCSSLRYAKELMLSDEEKVSIGTIRHVEGSIMKSWNTYGVHLIEPLIIQVPERKQLQSVRSVKKNGVHSVLIEWANASCYLKVTGNTPAPLELKFYGEKGSVNKVFNDSYNCFKASLTHFVEVVRGSKPNIDRAETLEIIKIIEDVNLNENNTHNRG